LNINRVHAAFELEAHQFFMLFLGERHEGAQNITS